ncbi:LysR substrate-binding domain-containing protein [Acidihalobacter ferrooxydans]|uniref:Transcriptional regulator CysB n=1 Tax=Acidihalobacter ferrooxydans TaxID=1765967 RepID=A0A1P8UFV5_9GAMM|nr:LysR substrate-binding domain-containing protein [Acidihalobacter ferrooxydans]APZ42732.1 transcriptional regulator CysB [Acidihalobacter ferrooxydans]
MNLRQVQYVCAVVEHGFSVTAAATALFTSQPGISKQIRLLEEELGGQIFERYGRQLLRLTEFGQALLPFFRRCRTEAENIRRAAKDLTNPETGDLSIATAHNQARYALPPVIAAFRRRHPSTRLHLHQGEPDQIAELAAEGRVDFVIATEGLDHFSDLVLLPCYRWGRAVVVPRGHPLEAASPFTLATLARYPLVSYTFGFGSQSGIYATFARRQLSPELALTAPDTEVIKTYVRQGLGVGLIAKMAYDPDRDSDLSCLDAGHLFPLETTSIGLRHGLALRGYMYDFIHLFAPHFDRVGIEVFLQAHEPQKQQRLFRAHLAYLSVR